MKSTPEVLSEVFPLVWSEDVAGIVDWAVTTLGLEESWRAPGTTGEIEHAELSWPGGRISVNAKHNLYRNMGPSGIALRVDDPAKVDSVYQQAVAAGGDISQALQESRVAYSFTATDPDGNQWWVNAETGFLDELRR